MKHQITAFALLLLLGTLGVQAVDLKLDPGSALTGHLLKDPDSLQGEESGLTTVASGTFKKYRFKAADNEVSTSSSSFVTIPNMSTSVTLAERGNVMLTFCGECVPVTDDESNFPVLGLLDGNDMLPAGGVARYMAPAGSGASWYHSSCAAWFYKDVAAGSHDIEVQWKSDHVGETPYCRDRSIFVQYRQ